MTNNELCNILGCGGCIITCGCMGLVFFGVSVASWGLLVGIAMMVLGLTNYD